MIYTCYEMIRDCRTGIPEGWSYLITNYVPVLRRLEQHYGQAGGGPLPDRVLASLREPWSNLFQSLDPAPERCFVAELRQAALALLEPLPPVVAVDLETVAEAFQPLTMMEKQAAWLETMRYSAAATAPLLRMAPTTVEKIRGRSAELMRQKVDSWRSTLLSENGLALGRAAAAARGNECLPVKMFLDILDGRTTWRGREELERHVTGCWHCIDHFCRMAEVVELLRGNQPLGDAEAEPYRRMLGLTPAKRSFWQRK
jgi:hypothetical protein